MELLLDMLRNVIDSAVPGRGIGSTTLSPSNPVALTGFERTLGLASD